VSSASGFDAPHPGVRHPRARRRGQWSPITDGLIAYSAGILVIVSLWAAATQPLLGRAEEWDRYQRPDGLFSIEHPRGWDVQTQDAGDSSTTVIMRSERIRLVVLSAASTALGGIRGRATAGEYAVPEALHDAWTAEILSDEVSRGEPQRTVLGAQAAVWSRFTAHEGRSSTTGYVAALAPGEHIVLATAVAPSSVWEDFQPIALRMLRSLRFSSPAPPGSRR
jgi:hypothetical protein